AQTSARLIPLLELNSQFFIAILLMLGGWRTFHGYMEIEDLIQFFFLANYFFSPIQVIGNQYNQALVAMAGAERVFKLVDMPPDWTDAADATPLSDPRREAGAVQGKAFGARVEFKDVSFGYTSERTVLHQVSFVARPGETIALVGHTGSGKSSIINLVSKFYLPTQGEIFIDGREIRTLTSESLHQQMGMVQQQNFLFSGTLYDNIRLAKPDATLEEVREAARRLDCLDILEALPQGLMTEVGERGSGLSVGQRQLVCFTRALLADPRVLILDEATSSIDAITESRLQKALQTLLVGRTSFVVAHRLSTIRNADAVLVLDQGKIIERGTHAKLMSQKGHYAALYEQFVQVDDRN
ncbi:MAG TPA: ABC transporter ATP-binding protein, partial [Opitutaceae bacterium]|nr:ABC transporter ATP-binding protein [Opitutaceae bacterium]